MYVNEGLEKIVSLAKEDAIKGVKIELLKALLNKGVGSNLDQKELDIIINKSLSNIKK